MVIARYPYNSPSISASRRSIINLCLCIISTIIAIVTLTCKEKNHMLKMDSILNHHCFMKARSNCCFIHWLTCKTISEAVSPQLLVWMLSNKKSGSGALSGILSWVKARLIVVAQKFNTMNNNAAPVFLSSIGYGLVLRRFVWR